jgi:hypothetical protein
MQIFEGSQKGLERVSRMEEKNWYTTLSALASQGVPCDSQGRLG